MNSLLHILAFLSVIYVAEQFFSRWSLDVQGFALIALAVFIFIITLTAIEHDIRDLTQSFRQRGNRRR